MIVATFSLCNTWKSSKLCLFMANNAYNEHIWKSTTYIYFCNIKILEILNSFIEPWLRMMSGVWISVRCSGVLWSEEGNDDSKTLSGHFLHTPYKVEFHVTANSICKDVNRKTPNYTKVHKYEVEILVFSVISM